MKKEGSLRRWHSQLHKWLRLMSLAKQLMASDQTFCIIISITIIFLAKINIHAMGNKYNKYWMLSLSLTYILQ